MATKRPGKGEQANGEAKAKDGVEDMKGAPLTDEGQLRSEWLLDTPTKVV